MIDALWYFVLPYLMRIGLPMVAAYHTLLGVPFVNTAAVDAQGVELMADGLLSPLHFLLEGQAASPTEEKGYTFSQRFDYKDHFLVKTTLASLLAPFATALGLPLKALTLLTGEGRARCQTVSQAKCNFQVKSNLPYYRSLGISVGDEEIVEALPAPRYARGKDALLAMRAEKEGLRAIMELLDAHQIPHWIDCGTCLGALRYGGVIPWDWDLDMAVLAPDFDNIYGVLQGLDGEKYMVQDWSSRERPKSYLKVYVKESATLIDLYHFEIDPEKKALSSIFSMESCPFFPETMKIRERRYSVPTPFELVFPRKRGVLDGIAVLVPGETKKYLQMRYGENLDPPKIFNPQTGEYEKDLNHPYWQLPFAR
jgi:hypothetical protein